MAFWAERWPEVPIYTSAYLPDATYEVFRQAQVRTSFVQHLASSPRVVMRVVFPLMVPGFRRFDFSGYDVVLSSSAYAAKAIRVPPGVCHLCYCYTPLRFAWRPDDYLSATTSPVTAAALRFVASIARRWDYRVAQGVFAYATTCRNVAARIKTCYGREAEVINAPVQLDRYHVGQPGDYYLVVSRLEPVQADRSCDRSHAAARAATHCRGRGAATRSARGAGQGCGRPVSRTGCRRATARPLRGMSRIACFLRRRIMDWRRWKPRPADAP